MEIANLSAEEQKTLHQIEEKLGMVLVAYQRDSNNGKEIPSPEETNESLTSSSM
ncbi:MAG TPA: hypothetical protein VLK78_05750 [Candidatus Angelobacter sp.]|nr:hypothetical protein [Candidatus Angelobacter sp.]